MDRFQDGNGRLTAAHSPAPSPRPTLLASPRSRCSGGACTPQPSTDACIARQTDRQTDRQTTPDPQPRAQGPPPPLLALPIHDKHGGGGGQPLHSRRVVAPSPPRRRRRPPCAVPPALLATAPAAPAPATYPSACRDSHAEHSVPTAARADITMPRRGTGGVSQSCPRWPATQPTSQRTRASAADTLPSPEVSAPNTVPVAAPTPASALAPAGSPSPGSEEPPPSISSFIAAILRSVSWASVGVFSTGTTAAGVATAACRAAARPPVGATVPPGQAFRPNH
jgi:hypothetical protein